MAVNVVLKSVFDDKGIKQAQNEFAKVGKTLGVAFAAVGAATAAAAAGLVKFGADSIRAAENVAQADNRLAQVAKSMGLFGSQTQAVTKRLIDFAEANELTVAVDAEVIKATQAKLLTFKNLAETADTVGGAMDRATMAALDLAAAGFGSAETNAVQLGKALQDPIKGITALARAGVTFTAQEKEKIKALVQSGQVLEAQNLILTAIETQVGGTAEATAKASDKMKLAFDNIAETVGEALLPVFNEFAEEVVKLTPELEKALAPAAAEVAKILREQVLPAIKNFTNWLASPQGTKTLRDLTQAVIDAIKSFFDFVTWAYRNRDALAAFAIGIGTVIVAVNLYKTAIALATAAQLLFNSAAAAFPFGAALIGLGAIAAASYVVYQNTKDTTRAMEEQRQEILRNEDAFVTAATNGSSAYKGLIPTLQYTTHQTGILGKTTSATAEQFRTLNRLRLAGLRKEIQESSGELNRFANSLAGIQGKTPAPATPSFDFGGAGGAVQESAFERVQKIIKDTQKKLDEAQKRYDNAVAQAQSAYNKTVADASERYAESIADAETRKGESLAAALKAHTKNIATIQANFAKAQADIITQSINRLRDAYASAVRVNVADLFGTETVGKSIDNLITNLRDRLNASRTLVSNAALLASKGFSQTFIEQIVGAGLDTGNELSKAILEATPETQRELQSLFSALESESETGMDSVARTIFDKTGLATTELKKLFAQTQTDLVEALKQAELDYTESQSQILKTFDDAMLQAQKTRDDAFANANERLQEALSEARDAYIETVEAIKAAFLEQIEALEGALGGLGKTIQQLIALMNELLLGTQGPIKADFPTISNGQLPNSLEGLFPSIPGITGDGGGGGNMGGILRPMNAININVSVDPTQSPAMVGAAVARSINKYTGGGGGLRGIGVIPV